MKLNEKINADLKVAMKSGNKIRLQTLRSIRALILEFEKSGSKKKFDQNEEINLLSTAAKKRKESIEEYKKAGRDDLAFNEKKELEIIMSYLPKQLTEEEIISEVKKLAIVLGAKSKADFPKLMPAAIKELKGKADGKTIKTVVEKILSTN
ncbi:MAG: GatB/YqeY domain-containing protein [Ignavibacteriaceae bacterium]|nr:GatB/YqeY domain-containing protein [Ignavibacteria bacterium]NNJ53137.1 GatB/YqeY domain-containing protein [Ignavibacteriaceae bacterium]NNL19769.1 GatB/YqeY domain-containing protein [Ignavibacteriaceae bacterium]